MEDLENQRLTSFSMYKVNTEPKYYLPTKWDRQINVKDITKLKIFVNNVDCFGARNLNIFTNYTLTFFNAESISEWSSKGGMSFYQNKFNFTIWCAISGCEVSAEHLTLTQICHHPILISPSLSNQKNSQRNELPNTG
jgi:hypothetical protein